MPAYEELKQKQNHLIRKGLDGSVFCADTSATAIVSLTEDTGGGIELATLPSGYDDLGWVSADGAQFSREVESSDITSWGSVEPTRRDITSDVTTLAVMAQETKMRTIGLYTGADMSGITPDPATGEVSVAKPDRPTTRYYRVLSLAVDQGDAGEIYVARFLPRASVTEFSDQAQNNSDEPITYGVTFTGYMDAALGYSERYLFGGPGWQAMLADMGFPAGPPTLTAIEPTSGPAAGGTPVVLTGTNFVAGATVDIGGAAATGVTVDSTTQISATTPAGTTGAVDVSVTTSEGTDTLVGGFTYT